MVQNEKKLSQTGNRCDQKVGDNMNAMESVYFEIAKSNPSSIVKAWEKLNPDRTWIDECKSLILGGKFFAAVENCSRLTGWGLKEAKKACEDLRHELLR